MNLQTKKKMSKLLDETETCWIVSKNTFKEETINAFIHLSNEFDVSYEDILDFMLEYTKERIEPVIKELSEISNEPTAA